MEEQLISTYPVFDTREQLMSYVYGALKGSMEQQKIFGKINRCLINFRFSFKDFKVYDEKESSADDLLERHFLLKLAKQSLEYFEEDIGTRKACFCNVRDKPFGNTKMHFGNCIVLFHLYVLDDKLSMNVYCRSQNFKKNFNFDLNTFVMIINYVAELLNVEKGRINVQVYNVHAIEATLV